MSPELSPFAKAIFERTYQFNTSETWEGCAARVAKAVASDHKQEQAFFEIIRDRYFIPAGRFLYSSGRKIFQSSNCFTFVPQDSREGWAQLIHDSILCLSMGGGVGANYSQIRPSGAPIRRMGGVASGPVALMQILNEAARHVMSGGVRRSALLAGLAWDHDDVHKFIEVKDWDHDIKDMKSKRYDYPAPLDQTNLSVFIDNSYIERLNAKDPYVEKLHYKICSYMARTGEPAFINLSRMQQDDPGAQCVNPCGEATMWDGGACVLGSIVLPRIRDLAHMEEVVRLATRFLINGSVRGYYPTERVSKVAKETRRIGLGMMGIHEKMLLCGHRYEWFSELESYVKVWADVSRSEAIHYADSIGESWPITCRAMAPNGTISIMGGTTSGLEPIFATAYKRRYISGDKHLYQYVIDPTAQRLIHMGLKPTDIEDAYDLAQDIERRIYVQARLQEYTDQGISSTINVPEFGASGNNNISLVGDLVKSYLPKLKGITLFPNKSRPGQPIEKVTIDEANSAPGVVFEESSATCASGVCGL